MTRDGILEVLDPPGYTTPLDVQPCQVANEQFRQLGQHGLVRLVADARRVLSRHPYLADMQLSSNTCWHGG